MNIITVAGQARSAAGRHANARLRRSGLLPAVIYGHKEPPESVSLSRHELQKALSLGQHVISLRLGSQEKPFLIKEVQYDHLDKTPIHIDLMRVDAKERVKVHVAIELRGDAPGLRDGGEMVQVLTELHVECPLLSIPDSLRVRIDHLKIGDAVYVRDVELPADVSALHDPGDLVVSVRTKRGMTVEEVQAAEGASEPEVIGRVAKEEAPEGED